MSGHLDRWQGEHFLVVATSVSDGDKTPNMGTNFDCAKQENNMSYRDWFKNSHQNSCKNGRPTTPAVSLGNAYNFIL